MRKTYGPEYPRTLSALLERPHRDPERAAVTDAGATVNWREFRDRVLRAAVALRQPEIGSGSPGRIVVAESRRLSRRHFCLRLARGGCHSHQHAVSLGGSRQSARD